ncbi:hypothetical protein [Actinomycetospora straminea]|uniref:Uncharacterized protein n=1 Tax=Actinomycetospora straminea TaxID=663607 RepID=A0ABP9F3R6_9PSEU|nr:hypothetical protein [Actinomycetospora straminea]MDD7931758.1 hypothetical protein [Actinomycetospora straminea]
MTAVRSGPVHAAPATSAVPGVVRSVPPPTPPGGTTGRHARRETGAPSGPLVRLRTVVRAPEPERALEVASGRLVIDSSYSRLTPHLGARRVAVSVDGLPWRFAWGRTPIDLPAGRHLVEIEVEHGRAGRRAWGHVADAVPVAAGHTVEVFYRAPALPRLAGSLGPSRQRTAGFSLCAALLLLGGAAVLAGLALLVTALVQLVA